MANRWFYVVQRGDTPSQIAERLTGNYADFRNLPIYDGDGHPRSTSKIYPGDMVMMPEGWAPGDHHAG